MPEYIEDGNVGYLTATQFDRFQWAVNDAVKHVSFWRVAGYVRSGDPDELSHRSNDRPLGVPPTWIAAEEVSRLLAELNQWPELEDAANDEYGAWLAEELTREVETAKAKWPLEDRPHRVKYIRCQACGQLSLTWHPPRGAEDTAIIRCREKSCRAVMDDTKFAFWCGVIEHENKLREEREKERKRARRLGNGKPGGGSVQSNEEDGVSVGSDRIREDDAPDADAVA